MSQAINLISMNGTGPNLIKKILFQTFSVDWEDLLKTDELNSSNSTKMYLGKINILLDTYAPLKRVHKYKMKSKSKPWVTLALQKSISVKNKLCT